MPASETLVPSKGSTTAADGTTLGWLSLGEGPGLVIVHGAMQSARSQLDLAQLLAPHHRVHLVDRRGRGLSGPYPQASTYTDLEAGDLAAVLAATGARNVMAISSGALIAMRTAVAVPSVERLVAFEPALGLDGSMRIDMFARFQRELANGDLPDAMVTSMIAAEMGPALFRKVPRALLRPMIRKMLNSPTKDGEIPIGDLVTALRVDMSVVRENADALADFAAVRTRTLLIDGTRTRPYLRKAVAQLAGVIPDSRRVSLDGTNHGATQNRDQWGKPDVIAPVLLEFLANS
jgi:pimeloyl-ACP methyl ester carboxylesterase